MINAKDHDADTECARLFPGIQAVDEEEARDIAKGQVAILMQNHMPEAGGRFLCSVFFSKSNSLNKWVDPDITNALHITKTDLLKEIGNTEFCSNSAKHMTDLLGDHKLKADARVRNLIIESCALTVWISGEVPNDSNGLWASWRDARREFYRG